MLATALRRHRSDGPFDHLEQCLLYPFTGYVAGDRGVVGLPADLVDFVDVDDATLGGFDIVVRRLQQLENDVLDVASVNVVASAMVKGTSRMRASVWASSVLPDPVGPIRRILDLASSTSSCLVWWWRRL